MRRHRCLKFLSSSYIKHFQPPIQIKLPCCAQLHQIEWIFCSPAHSTVFSTSFKFVKSPPTQKWVLLTSLGCLSFTVNRDTCAEWDIHLLDGVIFSVQTLNLGLQNAQLFLFFSFLHHCLFLKPPFNNTMWWGHLKTPFHILYSFIAGHILHSACTFFL